MKIEKKEDYVTKLFEEADFIREEFNEPKSGPTKLPVSPGKWDGNAEYIPATRVNLNNHVAFFRLVDLDEMATKDKLIVTTLDGHKKLINTRYVLCADYCTIALCKMISSNPYNEGHGLCCFLVKDGCKLTLVGENTSDE